MGQSCAPSPEHEYSKTQHIILDISVGSNILMYFMMIIFAIHNCIKYLYPLKIKKNLIILFYVSVLGWTIA